MQSGNNIKFTDIDRFVNNKIGLYKIHTLSGIPLKVGISLDLHKRLSQHRDSKQKALKVKKGFKPNKPDNILSKQSILAKHLYFDNSITKKYNLKTEIGRQLFLKENCIVNVLYIKSIVKARNLEKKYEANGGFRYIGRVKIL